MANIKKRLTKWGDATVLIGVGGGRKIGRRRDGRKAKVNVVECLCGSLSLFFQLTWAPFVNAVTSVLLALAVQPRYSAGATAIGGTLLDHRS
jgi:hypothetical protein